ncbi:hypothetical protein KM043_014827 [Ampulex compressa]|nr:hypothetical protein KM043_014827 [Ampulex compressa]
MWISRQFMLPILIGVSLTSVSLAFLYLLYKEDEENRKKCVETSRQTSIECKVPRQFVPVVIGRGGMTIKEVQQKTGTQINFKEDNIECPDRVCVIRGSTENSRLAEEMIKSIIANQPVIEIYEMYVPQNACGRIIGRGGETVKEIQMTSSAKVTVEGGAKGDASNVDRKIIIKGTSEQIANALLQIEDKVKEEKKARAKLEAVLTSRSPRGKLSPRNTAVNNTENVPSSESASVPTIDGTMEVYVSAMETPSQFWVQLIGPGTTALHKLVSEMSVYYDEEENQEMHLLKNISVGEIVAAKFSVDHQWYRGEVISISEDGYCKVYFVDYGDHEMVELNHVLELRTDFLSLRLQAVECSLANVKSR